MFGINFLRNRIPQNERQRVNKQRQTMPLKKVARCTQEEKERGQDMSYAEVFEELHKKKKKDGTIEYWWKRVRQTHMKIIIKGWKNDNKLSLLQLNQHLMIWLHCGQRQRVEQTKAESTN